MALSGSLGRSLDTNICEVFRTEASRQVPSLELSLVLADQQLSAGTSLATSLLAMPPEPREDAPETSVDDANGAPEQDEGRASVPREDDAALVQAVSQIRLFAAQQSDLVAAAVPFDADYGYLLTVSPSALASGLARQFVERIVKSKKFAHS